MDISRHVLGLAMMLGPSMAAAGPARVLSASFEAGEAQAWTILRKDAYTVVSGNSTFGGSNFDGVAGDRFLLFGMGSNPGTIQFELSTVPGKAYTLSYSCGATDTQRFPIGSGPGFQVTFNSSVLAYYGKKTVLNHKNEPVEVDDVENLDSRTHPFSTPGSWMWRIHSWLPVSYTFVAKSGTTWIQFDTYLTNGAASVGVLDQVLVTTEPFAKVSVMGSEVKLHFAGKLQESVDLIKWVEAVPQPASPYLITPQAGNRFFRVEK